jgi:hypothetical protein
MVRRQEGSSALTQHIYKSDNIYIVNGGRIAYQYLNMGFASLDDRDIF